MLTRRNGAFSEIVSSPHGELGRPEDLRRGAREELLGERHLVPRVGVRRVELEHRELGVVLRRDPLVPEVAVDLVDLREAAHDEALQVELRSDPQVEVEVERVVVRHERPGRGAARERLHHRRLDLDEAARVEEAPDEGDELRADLERPPRLRRDDEVDVALAVPALDVRQAVPLVGERPKRLREEVERAAFTESSPVRVRKTSPATPTWSPRSSCSRSSQSPSAKRVLLQVDLHARRAVGEVEEDRLPHLPDREDAAGDADAPVGLGLGLERRGVRRRPARDDVGDEVRRVPAVRVERRARAPRSARAPRAGWRSARERQLGVPGAGDLRASAIGRIKPSRARALSGRPTPRRARCREARVP